MDVPPSGKVGSAEESVCEPQSNQDNDYEALVGGRRIWIKFVLGGLCEPGLERQQMVTDLEKPRK